MSLPMRSLRAIAVVAAVTGIAVTAHADTVTIPADRDNTLFSEDGGLSNGSGQFAFAGETDNSAQRRALFHFPLTAIPAHATISQVTLNLHVSQAGAAIANMEVHRLVADWGEGTSDSGGGATSGGGQGAGATPGDATWTFRFFQTQQWATPGGDFAVASSASVPIDAIGTYSWSSPTLTSDVAAWFANPSANFGWIVLASPPDSQTAKRFDSRENTTPAVRPALTVTYSLPSAVPATGSSQRLWLVVGIAASGMLLLAASRRVRQPRTGHRWWDESARAPRSEHRWSEQGSRPP
jgi:hypothetical protein